ncbi:unnamed protein product [Phaedon cochleariae]|uniref:MCM C-terminal AAA(+) ATPase domain-containing protein n=1 Tax=Phaedon cochleariae TaxID=80249 RepID=A0A9N9X140_PHACE|nr:unnamed protein product [Phaedon cochleariae]
MRFMLNVDKSLFVDFQKAGDRYDFTGTLIVVPDVGALALPGGRTQIRSKHQRPDEAEGVRGLKALGVRDLHYRPAFLACGTQPTNPRFGGIEMPMGEMTAEIMKQQMTDGEWKHMYEMSHDKNLYHNMINSLFPSIHGNDEVKKGILLMLFGGVSKTTIEGTSLRGDINWRATFLDNFNDMSISPSNVSMTCLGSFLYHDQVSEVSLI